MSKVLHLDNNEIEDIWGLAHLIELTELNLSNNKIDDIEALEKLTELKALDLSNNEISDISPLFKLDKLEYLDIKECKNITTEQIEDLKKALPNCTIRTQ
ncbi:MAG: leucine-rich repeat domain-containing protein [Sedimentisphaerales bacterium]|nr:leucine-rich repeat domain-containing protein [Sedimentisphaerales bacterium]